MGYSNDGVVVENVGRVLRDGVTRPIVEVDDASSILRMLSDGTIAVAVTLGDSTFTVNFRVDDW